ncbi:DUF4003 family protein [Metabacillus bambusae]|uniref:DUF4003 domain-containing protein n=1 Tax=Metabacillus bambusae TaxID=2795218 RepID=A0ABS3MWV7_9BACI|nr:DUF4003 family protein [Metabacillus bambusae]MBO1510158.1 DUF4003 domain-containing protein [Metabacillus bambusae]
MDSLHIKVNLYKDIFSQLKKQFKWHSDQRIFMLVAAMYVAKSRDFDLIKYIELSDYINGKVNMFSYLKSTQRFTTAAMLETTTSNPQHSFDELLTIYEKLMEKGFSRSTFSYISAGILLNTGKKAEHYIDKTIQLYNRMKDQHYFLTGSSDYPLAALIAQNDFEVDQTALLMEENYSQLQQNKFRKGNDLQFLSHILSLDPSRDPKDAAVKCLVIKNDLYQKGIKTKSLHYPYIGMLSFLDNFQDEVMKLQAVYLQLNDDKLFKWQKDMNFMMSVLFLMIDKTEMNDVVTAGLSTSIETIIQAQQAVMIASMSAVTASSSSDGG